MYLERLLAALPEVGVDPVAVANRRRRAAGGGGVASLRNLGADAYWTAYELPRLARRHAAAVIHHPLPAHSPRTDTPQVITVHDIAFALHPEAFAPAFRRYAARSHRRAARQADRVIAVSQTTARELQLEWGIEPEHVTVAPHGPGQSLPPRPRAAAPAHFLYVGDDEPRKELPTLLDAYAAYRRRCPGEPLPLVLAGSRLPPALGAQPGVRVERAIGPERLADLYAAAAALVHPARHEGFGLTVLEALSTGTPVLAADIPAVREVSAAAARLIAPGCAEALAQGLLDLAGNGGLRGALSAAGPPRAAAFSWRESARAHAAAYSLAVDGARQ